MIVQLQVRFSHTIYNHILVSKSHCENSLYTTGSTKEIFWNDALNNGWYKFNNELIASSNLINSHIFEYIIVFCRYNMVFNIGYAVINRHYSIS